MVERIRNAKYDALPERCMYPLSGETDDDFQKRMYALKRERRAVMSAGEIALAKKIATGSLTIEEVDALVVADRSVHICA